MVSLLAAYLPWLWLALGLLLMSLEVVVPGIHFLWFGIAAVIVAFAAFAGVLSGLEWQLLGFAILSLGALYTGRSLTASVKTDPDADVINERGQQYVGRRVVVEDAIVNGRGRVRVGDTLWLAEGPDAPTGSQVIIKSAHGTVLRVDRT